MVEVGDRLDGGRVAAISDSELRYVKGGRNVVLKSPKARDYSAAISPFSICSRSIDSNKALKLPSPNPSSPLR